MRRLHHASKAALWHDAWVTKAACMPAAKEFTPVKDPQDGYSFVYPFGWQEVPLLTYHNTGTPILLRLQAAMPLVAVLCAACMRSSFALR